MDPLIPEFLAETQENLAEIDIDLARLREMPDNADLLAPIFRAVHTLKGSSRFLHMTRIEAIAHEIESLLVQFLTGALRPQAQNIDLICEAIAAVKAMVLGLEITGHEPEGEDFELLERLRAACAGHITATGGTAAFIPSPLAEAPPSTNNVRTAWARLPQTVASAAQKLGKKIRLEIEGDAIAADGRIIKLLRDALMHMALNAAYHGLETPSERQAAGKDETGHILVTAHHAGNELVIGLEDDGRGLSLEKIKHVILRDGLASPDTLASLTETQIRQYIFTPGFSTSDNMTSLAGRGVGLDVVKTNIEKMKGSIEIDSTEGRGTRFTIRIPL